MGGSFSLCAPEDTNLKAPATNDEDSEVDSSTCDDDSPPTTFSGDCSLSTNPQPPKHSAPGEQRRNMTLTQDAMVRSGFTSPSSHSTSMTSGTSASGSKKRLPTAKAALLLPMAALPVVHSNSAAARNSEASPPSNALHVVPSSVSGVGTMRCSGGADVHSCSPENPNPFAERSQPNSSFPNCSSPKGAVPISPQATATATSSSSTIQSMLLQGDEPDKSVRTHRPSVVASHASHHAQSVDLARVHGSFLFGASVSTTKSAVDPELQPSQWESWGTEYGEGREDRQQSRRITSLFTSDLQSVDGS